MTAGSWKRYADMWAALPPPMRPTTSVIDVMLGMHAQGEVLLLGVTPEIHAAFDNIIAVDKDPNMLAAVWPGDTRTKHAIRGQWWEMDWPEHSFDTIIGDCAITLLGAVPAVADFQRRCLKWLRPGGTLVHRVMIRPDVDITDVDIIADLGRPKQINFHAFRWRLGQWVAKDHGGLAQASTVWQLFQDMVPDRDVLCAATGWTRAEVDSIDLYMDNPQKPFFGTRTEWISTMPAEAVDLRFTTVFDHDFAEWCPIWRWRKP